jgi:uncharacterized protein
MNSSKTSLFLTAEWRYLAMLNYEVDAIKLAPFIPSGTKLDLWEGKAYVSLVGFLFQNTKVLGFSVPFHKNFEEINLRFYVYRELDNEIRRGVVFIKEVVPRIAISTVARIFYNENYVTQPTRHQVVFSNYNSKNIESINYLWGKQKHENHIHITTSGECVDIEPTSEEEFTTEHYWGYTRQQNNSTLEYKVTHPRWKVWQTKEAYYSSKDKNFYGEYFSEILNAKPNSAFLAEGSDIAVYRGVKL